MRSDELYQNSAELVGHVNDKPILVASQIENQPVIAHKVDGCPKVLLHIRRLAPMCDRCGSIPSPDRSLGLRIPLPELSQCSEGDNLHRKTIVNALPGNKRVHEHPVVL